ncbi:MAG: magnesium transporter [Acidimicrobiales bacterium]|nr:magnesium transporter [Acidimicrobiales bacterium]
MLLVLRRRRGKKERSTWGPSGDARQRFAALSLGVIAATFGGLVLASADQTLANLPGLLMLIPGAIALRGNIFGAMGSRLGTSVHTGTFRLNFRRDGVVGQNLLAAVVLSFALSVALAVMGRGAANIFGVAPTLSLADFIVVSTVGGVLASVLVGAVTVALVAGSVRFGWDLDNVTSPLVTALGDLITVPALVLAAGLIGMTTLVNTLAVVLVFVTVLGLLAVAKFGQVELKLMVSQSASILLLAAFIDLLAGVTVEKRLDELLSVKAVLIMLPAFLATAGALGGILSSRLSTQFHLGLDDASPIPSRASLRDIRSVVALAAPIFVAVAVAAHVLASLASQTSPGLGQLMLVALLGGGLATVLVVLVAYYTTMSAFRFGLDPDTFGIPMVTSTLDLVGASALILAIGVVGVV